MSGLADAPNTGGVVAGIQARFARVDAERRKELDRLIRDDVQENTEPTMPSMHDGEQGEDMAKRKAKPCCGSHGPRHKAGCDEAMLQKPPEPAGRLATIRRAARKVARETPAQQAGLDEMSVQELLDLRDQVENELLRREEQLQQQLAAIRSAPKRAA